MKQEEISHMNIATLEENIASSVEKLDKMVLAHKVAPLENPMQIRSLRKAIARLNTELTKKKNQA